MDRPSMMWLLVLAGVALIIGACGGGSDEVVQGGLLYDKWWEAAYSLNSRPRQTLGWMTPSQKLAEASQ